MKILILGDATSPFIIHFTKWLKKSRPNYTINIFNTSGKKTIENIYSSSCQIFPDKHLKKTTLLTGIKSLYYVRKCLSSINKNEYDIIILHFIFPWYALLSNLIKSKTKKLIAVFWGSDLNKISFSKKKRLPSLFQKTDAIILGSPMLYDKIIEEFPTFKSKYNICYFGCEPIEYIKKLTSLTNETINYKELFNIDSDKITIAVGYNGSRAQQHIKIIKNIKTSKELIKYKNKIHFIFPVTYGLSTEYKTEIINELHNFNYKYSILTNYLSVKESAQLRLATDIFINLQLTDSFNGTLRESFYAGSVIINGKWLPYQKIKEYGLHFHEIDSINQFEKKLAYCLRNFDDEVLIAEKNKLPIYDITSWSKTINCWIEVMKK